MQPDVSILATLKRGFFRCCPVCGMPGMFRGYLTISDQCRQCRLDFEKIRSDDAPAYFTIAIVGHILLPVVSFAEYKYNLSLATHLMIWLPLITGMTLGLLPFIKGLMMAVTWLVKVRKAES